MRITCILRFSHDSLLKIFSDPYFWNILYNRSFGYQGIERVDIALRQVAHSQDKLRQPILHFLTSPLVSGAWSYAEKRKSKSYWEA